MSHVPPLLTIAIPTFNRAGYLSELLALILPDVDAENDSGLVELLIINNASNDGTHDLIKKLSCGNIVYILNDVNIGGDRNFLKCIKCANGEYVWLFGDDEMYVTGSIKRILRELKSGLSLLIVESDFNYQIEATSYLSLLKKVFIQDPIFQVHHTLITRNIFRRKIFDLEFAAKMLHTNYAHIYGLLHSLAKDDNRVVVFSKSESAFEVRVNRAPFAETPTGLERKLVQLSKDYSVAMGDYQLYNATWIFFNIRFLYKLIYGKTLKRLRIGLIFLFGKISR
jgi:glycosyltransferase involved in cell wall biosynthesis